MSLVSSRIPGFHKLSRLERLEKTTREAGLDEAAAAALAPVDADLAELADRLVENVIGTMSIPLGLATNMIVDGAEVLVPMATEESSVIAALCNGALRCRATGGVHTTTTGPRMIAQVQITSLRDPANARAAIFEQRGEIEAACAEVDPLLVQLGGGLVDIEVRLLEDLPDTVVVHLIVDTRDAMGANAVNTMAETVAPLLARRTGGRAELRILSNLADRRLVRARAVWSCAEIDSAEIASAKTASAKIASAKIGGEAVRDGIIRAGRFARADPYRAATHNKGIMNGVSAVVLATGNDTRAVEAGAHAYAARGGRYTCLSQWEVTSEGDLAGSLEMPLALGIVGGATKVHPTARAVLDIMKVESADRLSRIAAAVGLVQNFSALRALSTEGIQRGHMTLHAKNLAMAAGAEGAEIDKVAAALVERGEVRADAAAAILGELRV